MGQGSVDDEDGVDDNGVVLTGTEQPVHIPLGLQRSGRVTGTEREQCHRQEQYPCHRQNLKSKPKVGSTGSMGTTFGFLLESLASYSTNHSFRRL